MKRLLWIACLLAVPGPVQGLSQMKMPMGGMPDHPRPAASSSDGTGKETLKSTGQSAEPDGKAMPFGQVADGDTSSAPRPVSPTQTPYTMGAAVQEQEHPANRRGSTVTSVPDLLADVKSRNAEPLHFFAERAAQNNPTLRMAEAQVRRLRAEAKQAGLWQNPELGYQSDHVRGGVYASGEQGGYVQQAIPLAGQRRAQRSAIAAQAVAAESVLVEQRQRVASAVEQAFYAALTAQKEVELQEGLAVLATDSATAAHQFANIGQADAPDVLQSEVEREEAAMELASAQRAYRKAFLALAAVSGDVGMAAVPVAGDLTNVPVLPGEAAVDAARESTLLKAALQEVVAGDAAIRSAARQAGPQLTLRAGLQQDNEPLESSRGRVGVVGLAQAGLTVPLWNRNQGGVAAARAQQASARAEVNRAQLQLRMQAEQAMQDYANAMGQAQRYRDELLPRAERALTLYERKYAAMAAAYPQTLAAQKSLLQLRIQYTRVLGTAWRNVVLLQHGLLQDGLAAPAVLQAPRDAQEVR